MTKRATKPADEPPPLAERALEPVRAVPNTLGEEAYWLLRRDILSGRLAPGTKLQFRSLAHHYGVGIAPLREALSKLASVRLVSFEGQRGFAVAPVSREELHDVCTLWTELSVAAMRIAIRKGDADWEADILASVHRLSRTPLPASPDDYEAIERWEYLHAAFHMSLISACGSPWRTHFCGLMSDQFERYRRVILLRMATSEPTARRVDEEHRNIAEAAVARDEERAAQLLAAHFEGSLSVLDEQYERHLDAGQRGKTGAEKKRRSASVS